MWNSQEAIQYFGVSLREIVVDCSLIAIGAACLGAMVDPGVGIGCLTSSSALSTGLEPALFRLEGDYASRQGADACEGMSESGHLLESGYGDG